MALHATLLARCMWALWLGRLLVAGGVRGDHEPLLPSQLRATLGRAAGEGRPGEEHPGAGAMGSYLRDFNHLLQTYQDPLERRLPLQTDRWVTTANPRPLSDADAAGAASLLPRVGGTRPSTPKVLYGSDGKPIDNALVAFFKHGSENNPPTGLTTLHDYSALPEFMAMIAPLLFSRGLMVPETPEWFNAEEPRPGAWRDPYPFVLPSSTPGNMVPGI